MRNFYWAGSLFLTLAALAFALQNYGTLQVKFLVWAFQGNMAVVLITTFLLGLGVGFLAALPLVIRRGRKDATKKEELPLEKSENAK